MYVHTDSYTRPPLNNGLQTDKETYVVVLKNIIITIIHDTLWYMVLRVHNELTMV